MPSRHFAKSNGDRSNQICYFKKIKWKNSKSLYICYIYYIVAHLQLKLNFSIFKFSVFFFRQQRNIFTKLGIQVLISSYATVIQLISPCRARKFEFLRRPLQQAGGGCLQVRCTQIWVYTRGSAATIRWARAVSHTWAWKLRMCTIYIRLADWMRCNFCQRRKLQDEATGANLWFLFFPHSSDKMVYGNSWGKKNSNLLFLHYNIEKSRLIVANRKLLCFENVYTTFHSQYSAKNILCTIKLRNPQHQE